MNSPHRLLQAAAPDHDRDQSDVGIHFDRLEIAVDQFEREVTDWELMDYGDLRVVPSKQDSESKQADERIPVIAAAST